MTGFAFGPHMCANQGKVRIQIMVEMHGLPIRIIVALLAFRPIPAFMLVVLAVTVNTKCARQFHSDGIAMAGFAFGGPMHPQKRKFRVMVMIKPGSFPTGFAVALFTFHTV